jgi:hypothetical protein
MAQPSWVTGSGSLGIIPEGKFYRVALEAVDPDFPSDATKVKYVKISGSLPQGIQISINGSIKGTPRAFVQGTPLEVSKNVTSKFSVRAYTENIVNGAIKIDAISDRTFTITVTGQDAPEFVTQAGELGKYFDGQLVNRQLKFTDNDPSDNVLVDIVDGSLPTGVTISNSGLIHGYISPVHIISSAKSGWGNESWDSYPLQFNTGSISRSYEFTVRITDGIDFNLRTFSIYVGITTADSDAYTSDSSVLSADTVTRAPFIDNYAEDLGTVTHNNFFSHQFIGVDYNGDILNYIEGTDTVDTTLTTVDKTLVTVDYTTALPAGLVLDVGTGFLYGTLSNIGITEKTYNFSVTVYKKENTLSSNTFDFKLTVAGDINVGVSWISNALLGTIDNGAISSFNVNAKATAGTTLQYKLKTGGIYNKLPQGLELLPSGNIVGKVSYQTFGVIDYNITADNHTTVDTNLVNANTNGISNITFDKNNTTFDSKFVFTVEAHSANLQISTFKTFTINVDKKYNSPTHNLQINTLLSTPDRKTLDSLLQNQDIIKTELLYRSDDPYYGVANDVSYTHAYGLSSETLATYTKSLSKSHYNKTLVLGEIKTAQALNSDGSILYEVVYSKIIDDMNRVSSTVNTAMGTVYPNSLDNMRNRVIDGVGQVSLKLPAWMLSKQLNGNILGFTQSWVIAYTLPGQSKIIAYNIEKKFSSVLNRIKFVADRYTLKSQFAENWDAEDQRWYPVDSSSFDIFNHSASASSVDATSDTDILTSDIVNVATTETTFDKKSCIFTGVRANKADISIKTSDTIDISADNGSKGSNTTFSITDKYDKYLMFPNKDIINIKQTT